MADATQAIVRGPQPGLLGDVAALHGRYYARRWGFPVTFEAKVAREMGEFLQRYDGSRDSVLSVATVDHMLASATLDGSDPALPEGQAHLRWFIVAEPLRGQGLGRRLLDEAMGFARRAGFTSVYLTTFKGLDAAAALYRAFGFEVVKEETGRTWGREVVEQTMIARLQQP